MKKFGTPSGAGPGSANEKVGLAGVGTPPLPCADGGFDGRFDFLDFWGAVLGDFDFDFDFDFDVEPVPELFFLGELDPPEFECPPPLDECGCVVLWGLVVVVGEVVVDGEVVVVGVEVQDSDTAWTGPVTGSLIEERGVPAGTLTVKVTFWPPTKVTVTTQVSAEDAAGSAATPNTASNAAMTTKPKRFRLLSTVA